MLKFKPRCHRFPSKKKTIKHSSLTRLVKKKITKTIENVRSLTVNRRLARVCECWRITRVQAKMWNQWSGDAWMCENCGHAQMVKLISETKKKNKKNGGACAPEVKRRLKCVCVCLLCFKCNCESFVILVLDVLALFNTLHSSTQLTDWDSDPNNFIFIIFNLHGTINKPFNIWSRFHTYSNEKHSHQHRPHVLRIFILFFFAERGNVINRFSLNEKHSLETNLGSLPNWILHHP